MQTIKLNLTAKIPASPITPSPRVHQVAAMFGLDLSHHHDQTLFENLQLELRPAEILLITGPSGAGKSTLLRELAQALEPHAKILNLTNIPLQKNHALIDCFPCPLEETLAHLSRAGLSEAPLLLRAPAQLSEGQSFRYRLAQFFASSADLLLADEFCATLDRVTAKVVSFSLAKFIRHSQKSALLATTHEDLHQDLNPHITIYKPLTPGAQITRHTPPPI